MPTTVSCDAKKTKEWGTCAQEGPLSHAVALMRCALWPAVAYADCLQKRCKQCGKWATVKGGDRHYMCAPCNNERRHPNAAAAATPAPAAPSQPPPLFERAPSALTPLSLVQRAAIVTLWKEGRERAVIAHEIPCSVKTVGHWIRCWEDEHAVREKPRTGRKRKAPELTPNIVAAAQQQPITTPRDIRRREQLPVSSRTVRRRLNEAGLYGCVALQEHPYTREHLRKRLSFAEGYAKWTAAEWDRVLFTDESRLEMGPHGRVWVQRPRGTALDPKYMVQQRSHPPSVAMWGCFSSKAVGDLHLFQGSLYAVDLRRIYAEHLLQSAHRFWPQGHWWLLHDGDKRHAGAEVQTWLFNKGVQSLEWPPYSPDLNPIENLWEDLKRRVSSRNASSIEELEQHVREE